MLETEAVELIGEHLAIRWKDGEETIVALESLRRACPCAACSGETDVLGRRSTHQTAYVSESFALRDFSPIGGYALQLRWGDGHATGIYSFDYLRRLGSAAG